MTARGSGRRAAAARPSSPVATLSLAVLCAALVLAGCSSGSGSASPQTTRTTTSSPSAPVPSAPVVGPTAPSAAPHGAPLRARLASRAYEQRLLADRPVVLWPLSAEAPGLSALGASTDAALHGPQPVAAPGPFLARQPRRAIHLDGQSFLSTRARLGGEGAVTWSLEMWFKDDGCSTSFQRVLSTTPLPGPRGRTGIDVFSFPAGARAPCRVGAEIWKNGVFQVGCAQRHRTDPGWHHYVITRSTTSLSCWVDGTRVSRAKSEVRLDGPSGRLGIGASGTGYGERAVGDVADVAVYDKVLSAATIARHARR